MAVIFLAVVGVGQAALASHVGGICHGQGGEDNGGDGDEGTHFGRQGKLKV